MEAPELYLQAFLDEAEDHLRLLDRLVPCLDQEGDTKEELHAAFRAMHSIKGGAAVFGLALFADLAHAAEGVLGQIRIAGRRAAAGEVDALSESLDAFAQLTTALRRGELLERGAAQRVIHRLNALTAEPHEAGPARVDASDTFDEVGGAGPLQTRFTPPEPGDEDGFGFFVPVGEVDGVVNMASLPDPEAGGAEFFVVLPGQIEESTGLPIMTRMPDKTRGDSRMATAEPPPGSEMFLGAKGSIEFKETPADASSDTTSGPFASDGRASAHPQAAGRGVESPAAPLNSSASGRAPPAGASMMAPGPNAIALPFTDGGMSAESIRVSSERLDSLLDLAGEFSQMQGSIEVALSDDFVLRQRVEPVLMQLERMTRELHSAVMALRLVPLSHAFNRLPRAVRDLAQQLGKSATLEIRGAETEVDKALVERLGEPLLHLVRNSLDHGIESPAERRAAGKPEQGQLLLWAEQRGGQLIINLQDDGAGLSRARILDSAARAGLDIRHDAPDDVVWDLIFQAGLTTAPTLTDVSGRGVGLDVVRQTLLGMGGRVQVFSQPGRHTHFAMRLPLTLAVMEGMLVMAQGSAYLLPLALVQESLDTSAAGVHTVAGGMEAIVLHGRPIPVFRLARLFERTSTRLPPVLVVINEDSGTYALAVDELHGQHSAVVKGLEGHLRGLPGVTGASVIGAGRTALILDPHVLPRLLRAEGGPSLPLADLDVCRPAVDQAFFQPHD